MLLATAAAGLVAADVASIRYTVTYTSAVKKEKTSTATVTASKTYVRRGCKWLSMLYQETRIK